jgi:hypothetical protein
MLAATWVTAIATVGLLVGAILATIYAVRTFQAQSGEIKKLDQDRADQKALTRQQIDVLRLQANELRLRRAQRGLDPALWSHLLPVAPPEYLPEPPPPSESPEGPGPAGRSEQPPPVDQKTIEELAAALSGPAQQLLAWQEHQEGNTSGAGKPQQVLTVHIQNAGTEPVHDVEIRWQTGSQSAGQPDRIPVLAPETEETRSREIPPGSSQFGAIVTFRDAAGLSWHRKPDTGELALLPSPGQDD